jgi:zinc protease
MSESRSPLRFAYGARWDGLEVVHQPAPPGAASFAATYVGPAGWGHDPPGSEGIARMVNQLMTSAAGPYDRIELARRLDRAGATLSRQCAPESAELTVWGPVDQWRPLFALLAEVVLRPRFDPEDVARVRRQMLERQLRELRQPASRAERELLEAVFPEGHPYRSTGLGDRRSMGRIRRDSLVRFHRDHYTSGDGLLVVTSPLRRAEVERAIRPMFSRFPRSSPSPLAVPQAWSARVRERRVHLPGNSQVEVRLGGSSIARSAPEFPAAFLANEILGGRPLLARLFQRVREKGGLAYHASSEIESMRYGGYWMAQAGTGADRYRRVVPMLREEVDRIRSEEVPDRELRAIRESAVGSIPLSLESTADAHELAVDAAYYHLPEDYWALWPARLRAVRRRELREAAEIAFDRASQVTVLAGPIPGRR